MNGWKQFTIEECCEILDYLRVPLNSETREKIAGNIPYYGANGVQGHIDKYIFDEDLILIAEDGGNFEQFATRPIAYKISGKSWVNNHAHVLRAKEGFNQDLIFYSLVNKNILPFIVGGTRSKLNQSELRSVKIELPKEEKEQTQIAAVLSCVDRAIEATERLIAKHERIKTGLMQDLLTRGIDRDGNIRSEQTHEFKDSPLGRIPKEWEIDEVQNLFEMSLGKMLNKLAKEGNNQFPYLANRNVLWDDLDLTELETMYFSETERVRCDLRVGDLLVCEGGAIGRTALWKGEMENCYFQKAIHRLRAKKDKIVPEYMLTFMELANERGDFIKLTSQTSIAHLTQEKLAILQVPLPSFEEQQKISTVIDFQKKQIKQEKRKLEKLKVIKTGLMQDLLTGKVPVESLLADAGNGFHCESAAISGID